MADPVGFFDVTAAPVGWFDETIQPAGWFDQNFLESPGGDPPDPPDPEIYDWLIRARRRSRR